MKDLYDWSVAILSLQLVARFVLALVPFFTVGCFDTGGNPWGYAKGVLVTLVDPLNGVRRINQCLNQEGREHTCYAEEMTRRAISLQKALLFVAIAQFFMEDFPELIIDLLYLQRKGWDLTATGGVELFIVTLALTALSMARAMSEIRFTYKNLRRIPRVANADKLDKALEKIASSGSASRDAKAFPLCCFDRSPSQPVAINDVPKYNHYTYYVRLDGEKWATYFANTQVDLKPWRWSGMKELRLPNCGLGNAHAQLIAEALAQPTTMVTRLL